MYFEEAKKQLCPLLAINKPTYAAVCEKYRCMWFVEGFRVGKECCIESGCALAHLAKAVAEMTCSARQMKGGK